MEGGAQPSKAVVVIPEACVSPERKLSEELKTSPSPQGKTAHGGRAGRPGAGFLGEREPLEPQCGLRRGPRPASSSSGLPAQALGRAQD